MGDYFSCDSKVTSSEEHDIPAIDEVGQRFFASNPLHRSASTSPRVPLKSPRRPRPLVRNASVKRDPSTIESDGCAHNEDPNRSIEDYSSGSSAFGALRHSLWSESNEVMRHPKNASVSSNASSKATEVEGDANDSRSSFELGSLDYYVLALIDGSSILAPSHQRAVQTYKVSREKRKQRRVEQHALLQCISWS